MAWVEITNERINVDSDLDESLYEDLRNNNRENRLAIVSPVIAQVSRTNTAYGTVATFTLDVPADPAGYTGIVRSYKLRFELRCSGGGTGSCQITDGTDTSDEATTVSPSYEQKEVTVTWTSTGSKTINVQTKATTGTVDFQCIDRVDGESRY